jgi:hypothetical protein
LLYTSVLKNEHLHSNIEDVKGQYDEKEVLAPVEGMKLFQVK